MLIQEHVALGKIMFCITAMAGCAQIPSAFTTPVRVYSAQKIWFRGSPEPTNGGGKEQSDVVIISPENEYSVILWDFSGHERIEKYKIMLKWRTKETHLWWEGQKGSYSIGTYVWLKAAYHLNSNGANK